MASSSPVPFWISAHLLLLNEPLLHRRKTSNPSVQLRTQSKNGCKHTSENPIFALLPLFTACSPTTQSILGYFLSYWVLGIALHCNFLPWTWMSSWCNMPMVVELYSGFKKMNKNHWTIMKNHLLENVYQIMNLYFICMLSLFILSMLLLFTFFLPSTAYKLTWH